MKPDLIIHAAGPSSVAESVEDPTSDFLGSVDVFYHVMDSVRRLAPSCKVLLLSSAAVYGNPQTLPVHEDAPLCPISPYGFHKKICEILIEEFHSIYGIRGCSVRIFSAYGAGLKRQVLWDISRKALWDKVVNLQVLEKRRGISFMLKMSREAWESWPITPVFLPKLIIFRTGATTIREVAETLVTELGRNCSIDFSQVRRAGDPLFWQADITRLSQLGYEPRISFVHGAAEYAKW